MSNQHDYMRQHGLSVLENGYDIVPITPSNKYPPLKEWQTPKITPELVRQWSAEEKPDYGIGIRLDNVVCVDIDVLDSVVAQKMAAYVEKVTGGNVRVVGMAPKTAYLFQLGWEDDVPTEGKIQRPYRDHDGKRQNVEILHGSGKQKVAFGIHPETGKPYQWYGSGCPLTVKHDDLPEINMAQIDQIMAKFVELAEAAGWHHDRPESSAKYQRMTPEEWALYKVELDAKLNDEDEASDIIADLRSALHYMREHPEDPLSVKTGKGNNSDWISMGYALAALKGTAVEDDARDLWLSICYDQGEGSRRWDGLKPDRTHYPVVFALAQKFKWPNPKSKPKLPTVDEFLSNARLTLQDIEVPPEPPAYLIDGLLPENIVGILAAKGGTGKSMLSLQMAIAIATGTGFAGFSVDEAKKVLIITAEDSREIYRTRINAFITDAQMPAETRQLITENLWVKDISEMPNKLTKMDKNGKAKPDELAQLVADAAATGGFKLVIIDTYSRTNGGMENSNEDAATFIQAVEKIKRAAEASVLLIAHTRKDAEGFGDDIAGGGRLFDTARYVIMLTPYLMTRDKRKATLKVMPQDQASRYLALTIQKDSYGGGLGRSLYFTRDSDSPILRLGAQINPSEKLNGKAKRLSDISLFCTALNEQITKRGRVTQADIRRSWSKDSHGIAREPALNILPDAVKLGLVIKAKEGPSTKLTLVKNWQERLESLNPSTGFGDPHDEGTVNNDDFIAEEGS